MKKLIICSGIVMLICFIAAYASGESDSYDENGSLELSENLTMSWYQYGDYFLADPYEQYYLSQYISFTYEDSDYLYYVYAWQDQSYWRADSEIDLYQDQMFYEKLTYYNDQTTYQVEAYQLLLLNSTGYKDDYSRYDNVEPLLSVQEQDLDSFTNYQTLSLSSASESLFQYEFTLTQDVQGTDTREQSLSLILYLTDTTYYSVTLYQNATDFLYSVDSYEGTTDPDPDPDPVDEGKWGREVTETVSEAKESGKKGTELAELVHEANKGVAGAKSQGKAKAANKKTSAEISNKKEMETKKVKTAASVVPGMKIEKAKGHSGTVPHKH